jgi:hypothetical protein
MSVHKPAANRGTGRAASSFVRHTLHPVWIRYLAAVAVYGLVFSLWQVDPAPLSIDAVGTLIAAICLFPFAYWYRSGKHGIPIFELICVSYLLQYGSPVVLQPNSIVSLSEVNQFGWDQALQSSLVVAAGVCTLVVAYYATGASRLARRARRVDLRLVDGYRARYLVAGVMIGLIVSVVGNLQLLSLPSSAASFVTILQNQLTISVILIGFRVYGGETPGRRWKALLYAAVIGQIIIGLSSGSLEFALDPVILLYLIRSACIGRIPILPVVVALVMVILLNSVKQEYRQHAWYGSDSKNPVAKVTLWGDLSSTALQNLVQGDVLNNTQSLIRRSTARFDMFHTLEWIQQETPSQVPYLKGSSYAYFMVTWVPRFIWPDKPVANGADTGAAIAYGFMTPNQVGGVSIGLGQLGLGYTNFGFIGVLLIMAFQGVAFALLRAVLDGPQSEGGRAIYLTVMVPFLNGVGGSTAILFGSVIQTVVANGLILKMFTRRPKLWSRKERVPSKRVSDKQPQTLRRRGPIGAVAAVAGDVRRSFDID